LFSKTIAILVGGAVVCAAADAPLWEPGKVVSVEPVSTPAKEPDPTCKSVPRGAVLPPKCRPGNLAAEQYWRVTIEAANKRYVVRPYRAASLIDSLNQAAPNYVDPNLAPGAAVEIAVFPNKTLRLRTDQGQGMPALLDSQSLISGVEVPVKIAASRAVPVAKADPGAKIVLLENGDFIDLEIQELKGQDIGDGAVLYSFDGESSKARVGSSKPVFMVLGGGVPELSKLQVGKGTRQMLYSAAKKRSASALGIGVTPVSDTVRRVTVNEPLVPGKYALILDGRAFLFDLP
jgi:hypothetical protein